MEITPNQNDHYQTDDTSLAVYLYCMGFKIIDIDYSNTRAKIIFSEDSKELREYERLYYTDKAQITPATYARIHKRLSTILRRQIEWHEGIFNV